MKKKPTKELNVAIIGFGVMGAFCALEAISRGMQVTVFEKGSRNFQSSATYHAGGMLMPYSESSIRDDLTLELLKLSLEEWESIEWPFIKETINFDFTTLSCEKKDRSELLNFKEYFESFTHLNLELIEQNFENLSETNDYYKAQNIEAHLDPRQMIKRIFEHLAKENSEFLWNSNVTDEEILNLSEKYNFVFDCRGVGLGTNNIRPVKGEYLKLKLPGHKVKTCIRHFCKRYPVYVIPRDGDSLYVGATSIDTPDAEFSLDSLLKLLTGFHKIFPNYLDFKLEEFGVSHRPTTLNGRPYIKKLKNIYEINGLSRHGITLAPLLAKSAFLNLENKDVKSPLEKIFC